MKFVKSECERLGISPYNYGIGNENVAGDGQVIFSFDGKIWLCYISERGSMCSTSRFENYFDAIEFFIYKLVIDKNNRIMPEINFGSI